eukprot:745672_1
MKAVQRDARKKKRCRSPSPKLKNSDVSARKKKRCRSPSPKLKNSDVSDRKRKKHSSHARPDRDQRQKQTGKHDNHSVSDNHQQLQDTSSETSITKGKQNFNVSGSLYKDHSEESGVMYSEPANSCMPDKHWRMYVFKGNETVDTLHLHRRSYFSFGRDRKIANIPVDHPSCSKQHAVIQFRLKRVSDSLGGFLSKPSPYIIDLNTTNGTKLNGKVIESGRYIELLENDVLKFGFSSRDYVILHAESSNI